jgi:hypothetical protein
MAMAMMAATAMQLHYARGSPPPTDRSALSPLPTPGRPRLQRFDDARDAPDGQPLGRLLTVTVSARSCARGSIDAIACRCDRGVNQADAAIPRYVERSHSSGTRPGRTSRAQHLKLRRGETVVAVEGHMGMRRLLHLHLRTSRGRSLEWGLEKRAAELEGGRAWSEVLPLGAGWQLAGFAGALRAQEGIIQLAPIWARDDSAMGGGLGEALGPTASVYSHTVAVGGADVRTDSNSSEDDIARYDDRASSRPSHDASAAASAAVALQRAFGLIGCLAHPAVDCAAGFPPLAVQQFIEWIGGDGHPKVDLFTRALAQLLHPEPQSDRRHHDDGAAHRRSLPQTIREDEQDVDGGGWDGGGVSSVSPTEPLAIADWISALWSAAHSDHPAVEVQESSEWLLLAASEADAMQGFPSQPLVSSPRGSSRADRNGGGGVGRHLQQPDAYSARPRSAPSASSRPERRQASHKQWAHWNLYVPKVLPARRNRRDGFPGGSGGGGGGGGGGAALREGILSQLASKALVQRAIGSGCKLHNHQSRTCAAQLQRCNCPPSQQKWAQHLSGAVPPCLANDFPFAAYSADFSCWSDGRCSAHRWHRSRRRQPRAITNGRQGAT